MSSAAQKQIYYSDKYFDETFEYRWDLSGTVQQLDLGYFSLDVA